MRYLIVDGYNIIGAWPELKVMRDDNLEEARDALISQLTEYAAVSGDEVIVVFDAWRVKDGRGSIIDNPYLQIIFTQEGVTADMAIERLVHGLPKYHHIYVATSDRLIQETVLSHGGLRISAVELKEFLAQEKSLSAPSNRLIGDSNPLDDRLDAEVRAKLQRMIRDGDAKKE